jgi:acetyl-CoA synthetase
MPMIPELAISMLACARHRRDPQHRVRRFLGRSDARNRILDSECKVLFSTDGVYRGKKSVPMKRRPMRR